MISARSPSSTYFHPNMRNETRELNNFSKSYVQFMTDLELEYIGLSTKLQLDWIDKLIASKRSTILCDFFHTHSKGLMFLESFAPLPVTFSRASHHTLDSSLVDTSFFPSWRKKMNKAQINGEHPDTITFWTNISKSIEIDLYECSFWKIRSDDSVY